MSAICIASVVGRWIDGSHHRSVTFNRCGLPGCVGSLATWAKVSRGGVPTGSAAGDAMSPFLHGADVERINRIGSQVLSEVSGEIRGNGLYCSGVACAHRPDNHCAGAQQGQCEEQQRDERVYKSDSVLDSVLVRVRAWMSCGLAAHRMLR